MQIWVNDHHGQPQKVDILEKGTTAFGEMALFPGEVSPVTAIAQQDLELLVIPSAAVIELIQNHTRFAQEMTRFTDQQKRSVRLAKGPLKSSNILKLEPPQSPASPCHALLKF